MLHKNKNYSCTYLFYKMHFLVLLIMYGNRLQELLMCCFGVTCIKKRLHNKNLRLISTIEFYLNYYHININILNN